MMETKTIRLRAFEKEQVWNIKNYIDCHLDQILTADEMAILFGISMYKMKAGFISLVKCSFSNYVKCRRMARAKELLLTTNKIIFEIALQCGYQNETSFYRAFKNYYNQSPDAFRKQS